MQRREKIVFFLSLFVTPVAKLIEKYGVLLCISFFKKETLKELDVTSALNFDPAAPTGESTCFKGIFSFAR